MNCQYNPNQINPHSSKNKSIMNKIDTQNPYSDSSEEDLVVNNTNKNYHNPTQKRQSGRRKGKLVWLIKIIITDLTNSASSPPESYSHDLMEIVDS